MLTRFRIRILLICGLLAGGAFFTHALGRFEFPVPPPTIPPPQAGAVVRRDVLSADPWVETQAWQAPADTDLHAADPASYNGPWLIVTLTRAHEEKRE